MNEQTKKIGLIVIVVVAIAAAAFGAKSMFAGDKMEVTDQNPAPAGFKSEKQKALEGQAGTTGAGPGTEAGKERDLGG